jgi:succinate dehydrogenase/fumarate reductase flavoprotein subunit
MTLDTFNKRSRPLIFRKLVEEQFDLLVIGGGITGASVFRDAALRGMKVSSMAGCVTSRTSGLASPGNPATSETSTSASTNDWCDRFLSWSHFIVTAVSHAG